MNGRRPSRVSLTAAMLLLAGCASVGSGETDDPDSGVTSHPADLAGADHRVADLVSLHDGGGLDSTVHDLAARPDLTGAIVDLAAPLDFTTPADLVQPPPPPDLVELPDLMTPDDLTPPCNGNQCTALC